MTVPRHWRAEGLVAFAVIAALLAAAGIAASRHHSPSRARASNSISTIDSVSPDYPQKVDWVSVCSVVKTAPDDPIVFPGEPGMSHEHTFSGNLGVSAYSTSAQLRTQHTNCGDSADKSAYWMPSLLVDGREVQPYATRAYYRAGTRDVRTINPIPTGLKMIAGDPMATRAQKESIAGFHCRVERRGAILRKQAVPPQCPDGSLLEASVVFPNCWDGKNLDSPDHRSHMSYARRYRCDARHPVQIPQLTLSERFAAGTTDGKIVMASMNSPYTLHADYFDAWDPKRMELLVSRCIRAGVACATVSDRRGPP
jgi:hypothetical protein